ncbi:glycosyltransferase family 2 protein [Chitinimonas lacunae]|uniref:Glycosyltransferase family 2 protein n=1 Tax=Chitinimonas lacunae TaxID=1963018 RepID=A0ABV8MUV5_9NEIS
MVRPVVIVALIVSHAPDLAKLDALVVSLHGQVDAVLLIDNASPHPPAELAARYAPWLRWLPQSCNLGLAAAYNLGIEEAERLGASHLQTFDQDSLCDPGMLAELLAAEARLRQRGLLPGALGPLYLDRKLDSAPRLPRLDLPAEPGTIPVAYTINSGLLLPLDSLKRIGRFDERLFIQYVDVEWGWRALACGLPCYVVEQARLQHDLGDRVIKLPASQRRIPVHAPARNYYFFRNALYLARRRYIPLRWRVGELIKLALKVAIQLCLFQQRPARMRHACAGILDAWRGISGSRPR